MSASGSNQGLRAGVCLSTTRPAAPYDGQMIYETDTNLVRIWNGTAWKTLSYSDYSSGSVIQVQSTTKTDTFTTSSTSLVDVTGLSASITPSSTSSKIFVMAHMTTSMDGVATNGLYVTLVRGTTPVSIGDSSGSRSQVTTDQGITSFSNGLNNLSFFYLDSPATTSSTTYKIQVKSETAAALYVNRSRTDANNTGVGRGTSSITVMEIAG